MNREQRRDQEKMNRRENSKKNFVKMGEKVIPLDQIGDNDNLKECDQDVLELIFHQFEWMDKKCVKNDYSKCIIMKGCSYLDALSSLRFDITPPDDRAMIRDTMYFVGNYANMFLGMLLDDENEAYNDHDMTIAENIEQHKREKMDLYTPVVHDYYPFTNLPNKEIVDDLYASFVSEHADKLTYFLPNTRKSDVEGDEEYLKEVLQMILLKTDEFLPEAQVKSEKFTVQL